MGIRMISTSNIIHQAMAWMNIGGMPHDRVLRSMRLFAERVLPALE